MRRRARIRPVAALRAQGRRGGGGTRPRPPWHGAGEAGPPLRVAGERGREEGRRAAPSSAAVEGGAMAGAQGRAPAGRRRASEEGAPPATPSGAALPHRPDLSSSATPRGRPALLTAAAALCARSPWPRRLASSPSRPEQQQEGGATGEVRSPPPPRSAGVHSPPLPLRSVRSLHGTAEVQGAAASSMGGRSPSPAPSRGLLGGREEEQLGRERARHVRPLLSSSAPAPLPPVPPRRLAMDAAAWPEMRVGATASRPPSGGGPPWPLRPAKPSPRRRCSLRPAPLRRREAAARGEGAGEGGGARP